MLTTNSFGGNAFRLSAHDLKRRMREINLAAARLAREQAGGALVAGSIGPSGEQPVLPPDDALRAAFREQARALDEGGVDLFTCETFGDVGEARTAVRGIRAVSQKPILLQMTYREDGRTPDGLTPAEVMAAMCDLPLAAIGLNCVVGEGTAERVLAELSRATDLPLIARPNAGQPHLVDGARRYPVGPETFAAQAMRLSENAAILGGCCGTTPEHIAAFRRAYCSVNSVSDPIKRHAARRSE
jgi:methionine synthase I (cobalamin-dependent)